MLSDHFLEAGRERDCQSAIPARQPPREAGGESAKGGRRSESGLRSHEREDDFCLPLSGFKATFDFIAILLYF